MTRAEESEARSDLPGKWTAIGLLALCEVLCLGMWFSLSAVIPSLHAEFALDDTTASLYSSAVAVGFVAGTLASAVLGLADRIDPRRLFMTAALVAAAANGAILLTDPTQHAVIALRFITGACMAGVYPVGMKMASSWARADMGLLIGLLVGALTLGTAAPHLFNAFGGVDWRATLMLASAAAVLAALLVSFVRLGPNQRPAPPFQPSIVLDAWRNKALRLANFGYFGHMWELYAMWAWIGVFFQASFTERLADGDAALYAKLATFAVIAAGAGGCLLGGMIADRLGRTTLTMGAMMVSGTCAAFAGFLFGAAPWLVITVGVVWGVAIVADSAQFSSSVMELSAPDRVGTMVTVQTSIGFLLTLVTIHLLPILVDRVGWGLAFAVLANRTRAWHGRDVPSTPTSRKRQARRRATLAPCARRRIGPHREVEITHRAGAGFEEPTFRLARILLAGVPEDRGPKTQGGYPFIRQGRQQFFRS